ncbi:MAG: tRNA-binding protein [Flavobacteriales bacterium]
MKEVSFENFASLDIRVGTVLSCEPFEKARQPAFKLWIDFGDEIGERKSSAQITDLYESASLVGTQVLAVVNFPKKQIADFMSEALVLGVYSNDGVVLLRPDAQCVNGAKVG